MEELLTPILDIVTILFLSLLSAGISSVLNYALGLADNESISTGEIFFGYTLMLSRRRLKSQGDYKYVEELERSTFISNAISGFGDDEVDPLNDFLKQVSIKKSIVERAQNYFGWEKAFGMCVYCTGVWIAVLIAISISFVFQFTIFQAICLILCLPAISHLILRKI